MDQVPPGPSGHTSGENLGFSKLKIKDEDSDGRIYLNVRL